MGKTIDMIYHNSAFSNDRRSWTTRVSTVSSDFYKDLKPLLIVLRALGAFPYHHSPKGEIAFKFLHPVTFYTIAIQIIITLIASLRENMTLNKIDHDGMDFHSRMMEYTAFLIYMPSFLVPLTNWPETSKKLRFLNALAHYQTEFTAITGKSLGLGKGRRVKIVLSTSVAYIVLQILLVTRRFGVTWWMVPFVMCCHLFVVMVMDLWIACCWELERAAFLLGHEMEHQMLLYGLQRGVRLAKYRDLWLRLSGLTRDFGNSMTLTVGAHLVIHFAMIVLFTYYTLMSIAKGEGRRTFHIAFILIFNLFDIYLLCSSAQTAAEQVGGAFRERLERLQLCFQVKHQSEEFEMQKFLNTIRRHKPVISLYGFADVNRGLQMSLLSSLVTYMVVLVQFSMGEQGFNSDSNCSELKK